jgi:large repetitive protein
VTHALGTDQYDPDGNTVGSGGITNTYDFENHLITHGGVTIVYDGDGNRVSETVAGVTTNYLVDTQNPTGYAQVVDELQNGSVTKTYAYKNNAGTDGTLTGFLLGGGWPD